MTAELDKPIGDYSRSRSRRFLWAIVSIGLLASIGFEVFWPAKPETEAERKKALAKFEEEEMKEWGYRAITEQPF